MSFESLSNGLLEHFAGVLQRLAILASEPGAPANCDEWPFRRATPRGKGDKGGWSKRPATILAARPARPARH